MTNMTNMTKEQFKTEVRQTRGRLRDMDNCMDMIFDNGILELRDLCINSKQMGIRNISELTHLTHEEQYEWYDWLAAKGFKANRNEVELMISAMIMRNM